ncbi:S-layer homology domain-containing protein [Acidaminobacter sp. JC074]|uniref:S-layer homology domain-containing protein n=1 Tax=Acidaminobacter sp. JC074 TaxID=2530199 RepID=UPI001F0E75A0|nr:S-layer homology domain-containing protein [Acidaminobacter sp. JC074]MCH4890783.1 S-layer homology domain-containing protein [Acidaminobacter sp. JC074]
MKKFMVLSIILVLVLQSITFAETNDEPSTWAVEIIESLNKLNILEEDTYTRYQDNVTRGEFIYIAVRVYETFTGKEIVLDDGISFTDTDDVYALKGASVGITAGIGDGMFGYDDYLTREQLATLMIKVLKLLDMNMTAASTEVFSDDGDISSWAKNSIYLARANGIVSGVGDNKVAPQGKATKEAVLTIAHNMLQKYDGTTLSVDGQDMVIDISANAKFVLIMYSSET